MAADKPRILYISSVDPLKGPGTIGMEHYRQFKENGFEIDMMTLFPVEEHPEIICVKKRTIIDRIIGKCHRVLTKNTLLGGAYYFFYKKETKPPVPIHRVLKKITKKYDLLIVYFWQGLLSFQTVDAIFEKIGHPVVFFFSPDYSHMTGGCHFPGDCERYQKGCGCCPAIHSTDENDFTHWNVSYRKRVYDKIKPVIFGNSYMYSFYTSSLLLKDARLVKGLTVVNTELFRPLDKVALREKYEIDQDVRFIIAFGCQHVTDERKGIKYLIEALKCFSDTLSESQKKEVLLLVAGYEFDMVKSQLPFASKGLGMIPVSQLLEFYSLADIFVCSSVNDAGPSMVGQSVACGTPVVGFEMGALLDWVKGKGTGYCAKLRDISDLANGIKIYYEMSDKERYEITKSCRGFALQNSSQKRIDRLMDLYHKYKDNKT